jgi:hypothetical protein
MAGGRALYGPAAAKELEAGAPINVTPAPDEDPAPDEPTTLPGEKLAAARDDVGDEPDWLKDAAAATSRRMTARSSRSSATPRPRRA